MKLSPKGSYLWGYVHSGIDGIGRVFLWNSVLLENKEQTKEIITYTLGPWKKSCDQPSQHIKKQKHYFANKNPSSQSYGFSSSYVWM